MMNEPAFSLACVDASAAAPVLRGVAIAGHLDGTLFALTSRQRYRNDGERVLEVVYTFPLPHGAVLLGFATELNGLRQSGRVVARAAAERRYESALDAGDAPVMLELAATGLYTANIGNLQPGDELVIEVRFARTLSFEQGRLRLAIPMTIAPRYGDPASAGLQPQQAPTTSWLVEYPLAMSVTIAGPLANAGVECPTHAATRSRAGDRLSIDLAPGARLDRDVVIVVTPNAAVTSLAVSAHDTHEARAPAVVMAALQVPQSPQRAHVFVKLLIDCSGSMGGDSIASARTALQGVLLGLDDASHVSLSRFGSSVEHLAHPAPAALATLRRLSAAASAMQADLGGTEMARALQAVIELKQPEGAASPDILLITDGEIWQIQSVVDAAVAAGQRVFAIGVGASPAEHVLRRLAEATGGACEFATPGEALQAAARRMLDRIRQQPRRGLRIDWGRTPVWQTPLAAGAFGGDTLIAFAGFDGPLVEAPERVRLTCSDAGARATLALELASAMTVPADPPEPQAADSATTLRGQGGDDLVRMSAAMRLTATSDDAESALRLAVDYQLISRYTHCVLVHLRDDADKAGEAPQLHRVPSMQAAGWGATSTLLDALPCAPSVAASAPPWVSESASASARTSSLLPDFSADFSPTAVPDGAAPDLGHPVDGAPPAGRPFSAPTLWRTGRTPRPLAPPQHAPADAAHADPLDAIAARVFEHLAHGGLLQGLPARCADLGVGPPVQDALDQVVALGATPGQAWLLLANWVTEQGSGGANDAAWRATAQPFLSAIPAQTVAAARRIFKQGLGGLRHGGWMASRMARLRRALGGSAP